MTSQIADHAAEGSSLSEYAFVFHRFVASRAGAWALYDPESPYVQIHANWGLPDALQFYPYDAWDVHLVTEEMTAFPSYKSHFLWPERDGSWTFRQVRNSVARHQCLRPAEVLDIARRTAAIGRQMNRRVAVMWFVGVETSASSRLNIPWYRTFDYARPDLETDLSASHVVVPVKQTSDLTTVREVAAKLTYPWSTAIELQPSEALVRDENFRDAIVTCAEELRAPILYSGSPLSHAYFLLTKAYAKVVIKSHRRSFRKRGNIKYHKLVRDGIPEKISSKKERVVFAQLDPGQIVELLAAKLVEEVVELAAAQDSDSRVEELADVYEVLRGIMHQFGVDERIVLEAAARKRERVGGFERGLFLIETSLPKPGEPTKEIREVGFDELVSAEYGPSSVRIPFALLSRLAQLGTRTFPVPGTDLSVRISPRQDGVEVSLQQQEVQIPFEFEGNEPNDR